MGIEKCISGYSHLLYLPPTTGMISGPCCVVDHVLAAYGVGSITTLVGATSPLDVTTNEHKLCLVSVEHESSEPIYTGPRIGLNSAKDATVLSHIVLYGVGKKLKAKWTLVKLP